MDLSPALFTFLAGQGPWAVLAFIILGWVLKENSKREDRMLGSLEKFQVEHEKQTEKIATSNLAQSQMLAILQELKGSRK